MRERLRRSEMKTKLATALQLNTAGPNKKYTTKNDWMKKFAPQETGQPN